MYKFKLYQSSDYNIWNDFVNESINGTFLFHRDFMEYHQDRFEDYSLMIFEEDQLVAAFPANKYDTTIHSHQGLTYGGLIIQQHTNGHAQYEILVQLKSYLKSEGFETLHIKCIPSEYHQRSARTMIYALQELGGQIHRTEMNPSIDFSKPLITNRKKLNNFRRIQSDLILTKDENWEHFWTEVLTPRLNDKHQVKPVHSLEEIKRLKKLFPDEIEFYSAQLNEEMIAGIVVFKSKQVVKSQYVATTDLGEQYRAVDFLYINLIEKFKEQYRYFDLGLVTDKNWGLLQQKEELGAEIFLQHFISLDL